MARKGFTLIEVLVALLIVSTALIAIVKASMHEVAVTTRLRSHTDAVWVGESVLSKYLLKINSVGENSGDMNLLNRPYHWQLHVNSSEDGPKKTRLRITVTEKGDRIISMETAQ